MLSIAQAAARRGSAGIPLPGMYRAIEQRGATFNRGQLSLVVGPASAGKSLLVNNFLVRSGVPALAFLLDIDQLSAAARFGAIITGELFSTVKADIDSYADRLSSLQNFQAVFRAGDMDDIRRQADAFEQRYGAYPSAIVIDNLGNLTSGYDNEWAVLKALTLELDQLARELQCAVIATAHTTDLESAEPAARTKILGRVAQYPRLILSVGFNSDTGQYRVAIVKNSSGKTDAAADDPVTLYADPARMLLSETDPSWTPMSAAAPVAARGWGAYARIGQ